MADFYKTVVKAISGLIEARSEEAASIKYERKLSKEDIEVELKNLNVHYLTKIEEMLGDASNILALADKDWRFED